SSVQINNAATTRYPPGTNGIVGPQLPAINYMSQNTTVTAITNTHLQYWRPGGTLLMSEAEVYGTFRECCRAAGCSGADCEVYIRMIRDSKALKDSLEVWHRCRMNGKFTSASFRSAPPLFHELLHNLGYGDDDLKLSLFGVGGAAMVGELTSMISLKLAEDCFPGIK